MSVPSVLEQILMMLVGVISTIYVGRIGSEAISAVGLVNVLIAFIMVVFVALSTGSTVLVARLIGEGNVKKANEALHISVSISGLMSVFVTVFLYLLAFPIFNMFFGSAEPAVLNLAVMYFRITLFTFPLTLFNIIISGCLRGAGNMKTPMIIAGIVNAVNIISGYILIFGIDYSFIRISGRGVEGAAFAVMISRGLGGILCLIIMLMPSKLLSLRQISFFKKKIDMSLIRRILRIGIPASIEQVIMQGGILVLQIVISGMGTIAIAVYQIGMSINSICYIPIWGFGIAATTLVGQSLGAGKKELAEKCGWVTLKISFIISVILSILLFIFARELVSIYSGEAEVIVSGASAIRIFSVSQVFLVFIVVLSNSLRGAGDIRYVMITGFVGIWCFRIAVTILLDKFFGLGIMGVWYGFIADYLIRSIMYVIRFKRGRWKHIVV